MRLAWGRTLEGRAGRCRAVGRNGWGSRRDEARRGEARQERAKGPALQVAVAVPRVGQVQPTQLSES
jgi:hypothetical protein